MAFRIDRRRNQRGAKSLLGEDFAGTVCSDRFGAYNWLESRGFCWAHLQRDFQAMAERFGSEWYRQRLVASSKRVMAFARDEREGRIGLPDLGLPIEGER